MNDICKELEILKDKYSKIKKHGQKYLENVPEGTVYAIKNHNSEQFYWRKTAENVHGTYIRKKEQDLIQLLAQKEYTNKVIVSVSKLENSIDKLIKTLKQNDLVEIYEKMSEGKRKYVKPYEITNEEYAREWIKKQQENKKKLSEHISAKYQMNNEEDGIITERGEIVRSKSEKILADKFYRMDIPYEYEVPIYLDGVGYIVPDFMLLNRETGREYIYEHRG